MSSRIRPRIILATNNFLIGGVQKLIIDHVRGADPAAYEFIVVTLMELPGKATFYDQLPQGIRVIRLDFKGLADIRSWRELYRLLRALDPDLVKTSLFFTNTIFRLLKPFFRYRVLAAEHNTEEGRPFWQRALDRLLAHLCHTIVTDSETVATFLADTERIPRARFQVIYNGIELAEIATAQTRLAKDRARVRAAYGLLPDALVFLNVARFSSQKGHDLMIDAFAKIHEALPQARLLLIGDGTLRPQIEGQIAEHGLSGKVILAGERTDIYPFYNAADAFLLTSVREGFCISAMNGLAFGLPLFSTRVAGVIEYVEDGKNGFFLDRDPDAIAKRVAAWESLPSDQKRAISAACRATASRFSIEAYVAAYDRLFREVLDGVPANEAPAP